MGYPRKISGLSKESPRNLQLVLQLNPTRYPTGKSLDGLKIK
jgi:hypothetical protein